MLKREGEDTKVLEIFYRAVVQVVLLVEMSPGKSVLCQLHKENTS